MKKRVLPSLRGLTDSWADGDCSYRVYARSRGLLVCRIPPWHAQAVHWALFPAWWVEGIHKSQLRVIVNRFLPPNRVGTSGASPKALDKEFQANYPTVHDWVTLDQWSDGSARTPSSLTLFVEGGLFKCCLNDKDSNPPVAMWASGISFEDMWACLEERLTDPHASWAKKGGSKGGGKK